MNFNDNKSVWKWPPLRPMDLPDRELIATENLLVSQDLKGV